MLLKKDQHGRLGGEDTGQFTAQSAAKPVPGLPFKITFRAQPMVMLGRVTGPAPVTVIASAGAAPLRDTHAKQVETQLSRTPCAHQAPHRARGVPSLFAPRRADFIIANRAPAPAPQSQETARC